MRNQSDGIGRTFALVTAYGAADGSPGPLLNRIPSGDMASTSAAGMLAGTTVMRHPNDARQQGH
jgi:hypothetical protein